MLSGATYWQSLTTADFGSFDPERTVAVLPVAATEQHGPHLPLGTDAIINRGIVSQAVARIGDSLPAVFLPAMDVGASDEHRDFAGTLTLPAERLLAAWIEIGAAVARAGITKLVILNTHGGQRAVVDLAALRLRTEHALLAVRCNYFAFGAPAGIFDPREWANGIHGGEVETSLLLHLAPDLVRRDALAEFTGLAQHLADDCKWLGVEKPIGIGWKASDLHPAGVTGNAAAADARRGAAYLDHIVGAFVELLNEVADAPRGLIAG